MRGEVSTIDQKIQHPTPHAPRLMWLLGGDNESVHIIANFLEEHDYLDAANLLREEVTYDFD